MKKKYVFAIDDDQSFLKVLAYQIGEMGFEVWSFISPNQALEALLHSVKPAVVITDLRMPEMNGLEFLDRILQWDPNLPVIVLTAHGSIEAAVEATKRGAFEFLTKPFEKEELEQAIRNAVKMSKLVREDILKQTMTMEISDTGNGAECGNLDHIFDPFYTTKPHGTGLGLSIAHQLVRNHGGSLTARRNKDAGLTLTLLLPSINSSKRCCATQSESTIVNSTRLKP